MATEHAYVVALPKTAEVSGDQIEYSFDPTTLLNISLPGTEVELSWAAENSDLVLKAGNLTTSLKVAVARPEFHVLPADMPCIEIPHGVLTAVTKYLSIPFSFHDEKKELMPVRFRNVNGNLVMTADDQFSLAKITTDVEVDKTFDVKVPKYILDCLYGGKSSGEDSAFLKIGVGERVSMFSNEIFQIFSTDVLKETSDFDAVISRFKAKTSCRFVPKTLSTAIKPLIGMIPKKKNDDTILTVSLSDKMSLSLKHLDIGEGNIDGVDDVDEIHNENFERSYRINMFPKAFDDYTKLFAVEEGHMAANEKMVYYKGEVESGGASLDLNYIFPVVAM